MRALTLKQPWATLVMAGVKDVENRSWPVPGTVALFVHGCIYVADGTGWYVASDLRIAIHAGARPDLSSRAHPVWQDLATQGVWRQGMAFGALLGYVTVTGCHDSDECEHICPEAGCDVCDDPTGGCGHDASYPMALGEDPTFQFPAAKCDVHGQACNNVCSPWADLPMDDETKVYHWTVADPQPFAEPIPMRGRQGLWTVPDDVLAEVPA